MLSIKPGGCAPDALLDSLSCAYPHPYPDLELSIQYQVGSHGVTHMQNLKTEVRQNLITSTDGTWQGLLEGVQESRK